MKIHYGYGGCKVLYDWNGRSTFYGGRAIDVVSRAKRLAADSRATNIRLRIKGKEYKPEEVQLTFTS